MAASERDLEDALSDAILHKDFRDFLIEQCSVEDGGQYDLIKKTVQHPTTNIGRKGKTVLNLFLQFKHTSTNEILDVGVEIKTPTEFANTEQLRGHLEVLKLRKGKTMNKLQKKKNHTTRLLVISKGNTGDEAVSELTEKYTSYRKNIRWLSWRDILQFIDKNGLGQDIHFLGLVDRLTECGVISTENPMITRLGLVSKVLRDLENITGQYKEKTEQVKLSLDTLDYLMETSNFTSRKTRKQGSYSFADKIFTTIHETKWVLREYQKPGQNFSIFFGLDLLSGKWRSSIVPLKFNKTTHKSMNKIIKKHSTKSSRILIRNVWNYSTSEIEFKFDGWEFTTSDSRTPKSLANFFQLISQTYD